MELRINKKICEIFKNYKENAIDIKKLKKYTIYAIAIIIMFLSFYKNIFVINENDRQLFNKFQKDSESLVIGAIIRDKYELNKSNYGLQALEDVDLLTDYNQYNMLLENGNNSLNTLDYKSQIGVQGRIFSFLYNKLHIPVKGLHMICSLILTCVLINVCRLLKEKYGKLLAIIFYLTFLLSPWIINFARNLYWIEFTWFLPLMFCLLLGKTKNIKLYTPMIFCAVLFKCLCGYEYLSTILLTAISYFVVDFFVNKNERKQNFKFIIIVGIVSVLAFLLTMCIHGYIRGNGNMSLGIETIIKEDVMRRTISTNSEQFENQRIKDSINATYISVIKKYFKFNTDILIGFDGSLFLILIGASLVISLYNLIKNKKDSLKEFLIYIVLFISTVSWFILGKAHSDIHTHMNFVLWYFGYIQMSIYIIINKIRNYEGEKNI